MKKLELKAPPFDLQAGNFVDREYKNYNEMSESATGNWEFRCTYELCPKALKGKHQVLSLENMLISLAKRPGGMMHDVLSAKGSITFAVQEYLEGTSTFDRMKLREGDIIIFDDSHPYNYMTNKRVNLSVVTIRREAFGDMLPFFEAACLHKFVDTDGKLGKLLYKIWEDFTAATPSTDFHKAEKEILSLLRSISQEQKPQAPQLLKGEEIAYAIRKQLYEHMDGNLKVSDLAAQYNISEKGLQNSFNSLFGFTPKFFMRQLKLNLVRHDLSQNISEKTTVMRVANKWGFLHMGRFSKFYTELFEENPSETLQRSFDDDKAFTGECVMRQEEIH